MFAALATVTLETPLLYDNIMIWNEIKQGKPPIGIMYLYLSTCNQLDACIQFFFDHKFTYWFITAMDSTLPPLKCSYPAMYIFSS